MYLTADTKLLDCQRRNAARKAVCSDARRDATAQQAIDGRIALFQNLMSPEDIAATFGPNAGHDAQHLQQQSLPARAAILTGTTDTVLSASHPTLQQVIDGAPKVFSLNGTPAQVNGCAWAPAPLKLVGPDPIPTMPLRAPVVVETPIGPASMPPPNLPGTPSWVNLCWAIRNGAVDFTQFEPAELLALQYRCAQLGYTGACVPPPNTQAYLEAGRRGQFAFPHIQVTQDMLNAIPQAPPLGEVNCPTNYQMGGLSGYAPTWSDALVNAQSGAKGETGTGMSGWGWWLGLALAAGGAVALSRSGR